MTQPVSRTDNLERVAAAAPSSGARPDLWTEVHIEIQAGLAPLETELRRRVAGVCVDAGRTRGERFLLFSYRTFSLPGSARDPVVVGMTFTPAGPDVMVEADVSGERTGDWIASVPSKVVAHARDKLLGAAREAVRELCQSAEAIAAALADPSRGV